LRQLTALPQISQLDFRSHFQAGEREEKKRIKEMEKERKE